MGVPITKLGIISDFSKVLIAAICILSISLNSPLTSRADVFKMTAGDRLSELKDWLAAWQAAAEPLGHILG